MSKKGRCFWPFWEAILEVYMKYYYTYRITNTIAKMHYYGDRSSTIPPSEDLGIKYFSSFGNKYFQILTLQVLYMLEMQMVRNLW